MTVVGKVAPEELDIGNKPGPDLLALGIGFVVDAVMA